MATIVKGAKLQKTATHIRQVRKNLPTILREKIGMGHADWDEFLKAIRDVDTDYIRDKVELWNKEQKEQKVIERHIQLLETVSQSPTAPLRHQLLSVAISTQPAAATAMGNTTNPFTNLGGGQGNLRFAPIPANNQYNKTAQPQA